MKKKILLISDDITLSSGVAHVAREIVFGSVHKYDFVNVGGAMQHPKQGQRLDLSEDTKKKTGVDDASVILYPTNGYGDPDLIRQLIKVEKPDALMFITDPRYYEWLFNMENEIRNQIPMVYLQIWDSPVPYPLWNRSAYESCDLLLAISKQTKNINKVVLNGIETIDLDEQL